MSIIVRPYRHEDTLPAAAIWNRVVEDGVAFPQLEPMTPEEAEGFFDNQSYTGIAEDTETGEIVGLYILHPNSIGRCGHICNASYAVKASVRGKNIGKELVTHCLSEAKKLGFRILQFNAVVATNSAALHLYQTLGFTRLGTIPGGFRMDDGHYEDIIVHYKTL